VVYSGFPVGHYNLQMGFGHRWEEAELEIIISSSASSSDFIVECAHFTWEFERKQAEAVLAAIDFSRESFSDFHIRYVNLIMEFKQRLEEVGLEIAISFLGNF
jgi:hypothetical protein